MKKSANPTSYLPIGLLRNLAGQEQGLALLVTLIALTVFSALGFYMAFDSVTEVRVSDNYESHVQAREAALAGINHARELLRGCDFSDLLKGPDGTYNSSTTYLNAARTYAFRNPLSWALSRSIDILNPGSALGTMPDDGVVSTGKAGAIAGTVLIPLAGIVQTAPNPYGAGTIVTSRYFVKVTDNNGDALELAKDPANNPFLDGDRTVIVRSLGISRTLAEHGGGILRANSVVVYEARFRRMSTFELDAPLIVEGNNVVPSAPSMFDGASFTIDGGANNPGIGTIDIDPGSGTPLPTQISSQLSKNQEKRIKGEGGTPSIADITADVTADPDKSKLLDINYLYNLATKVIPAIADVKYYGDQKWSGGSSPDIGYYDITKPPNDPSQRPKVIYVDGDLEVSGNMEGGGIMVVRGKFSGSGRFTYNGLFLIIGEGDVSLAGLNMGIHGGIFVVNVNDSGGTLTFGTPKVTIAGNSDIIINSDALRMAMEQFPLVQLSLREITSTIDP